MDLVLDRIGKLALFAAMTNREEEEKGRIYREEFSNPYQAAKRGYVDDVILPEETRTKLAAALKMLEGKRKKRLERKHGIIPV